MIVEALRRKFANANASDDENVDTNSQFSPLQDGVVPQFRSGSKKSRGTDLATGGDDDNWVATNAHHGLTEAPSAPKNMESRAAETEGSLPAQPLSPKSTQASPNKSFCWPTNATMQTEPYNMCVGEQHSPVLGDSMQLVQSTAVHLDKEDHERLAFNLDCPVLTNE